MKLLVVTRSLPPFKVFIPKFLILLLCFFRIGIVVSGGSVLTGNFAKDEANQDRSSSQAQGPEVDVRQEFLIGHVVLAKVSDLKDFVRAALAAVCVERGHPSQTPQASKRGFAILNLPPVACKAAFNQGR